MKKNISIIVGVVIILSLVFYFMPFDQAPGF